MASGCFLANAIMTLLSGTILGCRVMRASATLLAMSSWLLGLAGVTCWVLGRRDELTRGPSTDEHQILDSD